MRKIISISILLFYGLLLQAQVVKNINIAAGGLAAGLTPTEKATITDLTISGTIDARDFKTMRDEMPLLADVDISGTAIVAYSGTEGTLGYDYNFLANHVPPCAFYTSGSMDYNTTLRSLVLPETVTVIGGYAFRNCSNLSQINLPSGLIEIYGWVFSCMGNNLAISIPATTTYISSEAFRAFNGTITVSSGNPNYSTHEGVFYNKAQTVLYNCPTTKTGSYTIPQTVTDIKTYAFASCRLIDGTITVPASVTRIKQYTFRDCSSLKQVVLPSTLVELEGNIFWNCSSLETINIPASANITGNGVFINCINLKHIYLGASTPIDLSTRTNVFQNANRGLCELHVPSGSLFAYKNAVEWKDFGYISTPTQVMRNINNMTAGTLSSLIDPAYRLSITHLFVSGHVDARDFKTMRDSLALLAHVDISNATIDSYSGNLGTRTGSFVYDTNTVPAYAFYNVDTRTPKTTLSILNLPDNIVRFGYMAYFYCANLFSINIPESLQTIDQLVFSNSGNLLQVNIPAATTTIGVEAFGSFNGYISIDEQNPNYTVADGVLFNKQMTTLMACPVTKTGSYNVPQSVTLITRSAFAKCSGLTGTIELPNGLTSINDYVFFRCTNIERVVIPESVTSIGVAAFFECLKLNEIYSYSATPLEFEADDAIFERVDKTSCILYVPLGASTDYASATEWEEFSNILEINGIRLSGNKRSLGANQNSTALPVELFAYVPWTLASSSDWLFCSPVSGSYNASLVIAADANPYSTSRNGTITITIPGFGTRNISVSQAAGPGNAVLFDLEIQNRTMVNQTDKCFGAHNSITVAGNGTNVDFEDGSSTTLIAGNSIRFLPGFHAQAGSYVNAYITTNSSFCDNLPDPIMAAPPVTEKSLELVEPDAEATHFIEQSMVVYPNPNNGQFTIAFTNFEGTSRVYLFNTMGQKVYTATVCEQQHWVELPNLQRGIYFVKAINEQKQFEKKIVVQ